MIGILKCQSRINYIIKKYHDNIFELSYLKNLEHTIINETLLSQRGVYDKKYGLIPTLRGFAKYLFSISEKMSVDEILMNVSDILAEHVIDELETIDNNIEKAKNKKQVLIDITPHQTLSIEAAAATVEESKEVNIIIKDEVNGTPCIEFDNLFGADIRRKNEVWQYMKLLGMIDSEGKYLLGGERAIIRAFVMVMKKNGKFTPTAEEGFLIRVVGLKLLGDNNVRVRPSKQIQAKQNEIVIFLNNQETKNSSFINVG